MPWDLHHGPVTAAPVARLRPLLLLGAALVFAAPAAGQTRPGPPIAELMLQLQTKYDEVRDFSADFEHSYSGGVLRTADIEHGTVYVKKPSKWRFDYTRPEEKRFVSDGETTHSYFPADRQVIISRLSSGGVASTPVSFLAGDGSLTRDFTAAYTEAPDMPRESWVVRLTPVSNDADYEWLTLAIDPDSLEIRRMAATDFQGGVSAYVFSNLKENQGLSDNFFAFEVPRGTDVITDDGVAR